VSVEIAECSVAFRHQGVVAFDLAGGEAGRPPGNHRAAFDLATRGLLGITVHAGEAAGAQSIADAVHLCHADRIGHGTRLYESPDLQAYIRDRRILIEANITSNVQTRAVRKASEHPVRGYFDAGLNVTLCTDGWLMAGVSLSDEYWLAHTELSFSREQIDRLILNGFESAFLPWPARLDLLSRVRDEFAAQSNNTRSNFYLATRDLRPVKGTIHAPQPHCRSPRRRRSVRGLGGPGAHLARRQPGGGPGSAGSADRLADGHAGPAACGGTSL
jgi:adenosine deaminase